VKRLAHYAIPADVSPEDLDSEISDYPQEADISDTAGEAEQLAHHAIPADISPQDLDSEISDYPQEADVSDTASEAVATPQSLPTPPTDSNRLGGNRIAL
jgi:hypothetical protein